MRDRAIYIGTAGWNIPRDYSDYFRSPGSHLKRYSEVFNAVEINSSFYRNHMAKTYARWAQTVPDDFRFAVKLYKEFTHKQGLSIHPEELKAVLSDYLQLGEKLGAMLVQLPPSLEFDKKTTKRFFSYLRDYFSGTICIEPRHYSWMNPETYKLISEFDIVKVSADPEPCPFPDEIENRDIRYFRLHGTPVIYRSDYEPERLSRWWNKIKGSLASGQSVWCIFDNTTYGYATHNAYQLKQIADAYWAGEEFTPTRHQKQKRRRDSFRSWRLSRSGELDR